MAPAATLAYLLFATASAWIAQVFLSRKHGDVSITC